MGALKPLTERDYETLNELVPSYTDEEVRWGTPLDFGASNSSHHSATFHKLARRGLVEIKTRSSGSRGSKLYRASEAGVAEIWSWRVARGTTPRTRAQWEAWWAEQEAARATHRAAREAR